MRSTSGGLTWLIRSLIIATLFDDTSFLVMTEQQHSERIALLEQQTGQITKTLNRIDSNVVDLSKTMQKQRGFIAGVLFVIAPVFTVGALFAKELWHTLTN